MSGLMTAKSLQRSRVPRPAAVCSGRIVLLPEADAPLVFMTTGRGCAGTSRYPSRAAASRTCGSMRRPINSLPCSLHVSLGRERGQQRPLAAQPAMLDEDRARQDAPAPRTPPWRADRWRRPPCAATRRAGVVPGPRCCRSAAERLLLFRARLNRRSQTLRLRSGPGLARRVRTGSTPTRPGSGAGPERAARRRPGGSRACAARGSGTGSCRRSGEN